MALQRSSNTIVPVLGFVLSGHRLSDIMTSLAILVRYHWVSVVLGEGWGGVNAGAGVMHGRSLPARRSEEDPT